jgi:RND superfamily putative drug exporter
MLARLGDWTYRWRYAVLGAWVLILVAALTQASQVSKVIRPADFSVPGSESQRTADLLGRELNLDVERNLLVVIRHPQLRVGDPAFQDAVEAAVASAGRVLPITHTVTPYVAPGTPNLVSSDRHAAQAILTTSLPEPQIEERVEALRRAVRLPGYDVVVTGIGPVNADFSNQGKEDLTHEEVLTLPLLAIILLIVFGTLVGAALPLLLAGLSIVVSTALVYWIGHQVSTSTYVLNVVTIMGLGIGVDYALFLLYRFREELEGDPDVRAAVRQMMATAGHTVIVSGVMVGLALSTLIAMNLAFMTSMGIGGVLVPLTSLAVVLTAFPALLSVLGHRVNRFFVLPRRYRLHADGRVWSRLGHAIMRRPWVAAVGVVVLLLALALPATQLKTTAGADVNSPPFESIRGFRILHQDFGISQQPILIAVQGREPKEMLTPKRVVGLSRLTERLRADPEVAQVESPTDALSGAAFDPAALQLLTGRALNARHDLAVVAVTGKAEYGSPPNQELIVRIRHHIVPAISELRDATVLTGGGATAYVDFADAIYARFPYVVGIILFFSYLFLFWAFRSVLVPLKAVLLNLLALGAALGLVQLVFMRGIGLPLLGMRPEAGVFSWIPVFLFAFLFGLSTDYEIFLLSRIREHFAQTRDNRESVAFGLGKTGVLITSAAGIMVFVFGSFMAGSLVPLKETGLGIAAAILIDATLIRVILVPAVMTLMGDWNWWAPRFAGGLVVSATPRREEIA